LDQNRTEPRKVNFQRNNGGRVRGVVQREEEWALQRGCRGGKQGVHPEVRAASTNPVMGSPRKGI